MTANRRASTRELQVVLSRAKIQQPFGTRAFRVPVIQLNDVTVYHVY